MRNDSTETFSLFSTQYNVVIPRTSGRLLRIVHFANVRTNELKNNVRTISYQLYMFFMTVIKSFMYTPNEVQLAHELADALDDRKSLAFYLMCAKKYPREYLSATLTHVCSLPAHSVRTTRARLFTNIVTNSIFNTHDHTWD